MKLRLLVASLGVVAGCSIGGDSGRSDTLIQQVRSAGPFSTPWAVRLSVPTLACTPLDTGRFGGVHCRAAPTGTAAGALAPVAAAAATRLRRGVEPGALHAAALADLLVSDASPAALRRFVERMEHVTRLDPRAPGAWLDLSGGFLALAVADSDAFAILRALDSAREALRLEPSFGSARYNEAIALDLLALTGEASLVWKELQSSSDPALAAAARQRLAAYSPGSVATPEPEAATAALRAFAVGSPTAARGWTWERLLGEWGDAVLAGDSARAAARLAAANVVASALREAFGETTLTEAVSAIEARRVARSIASFAQAHAAYARALGLTRTSAHAAADSIYVALVQLGGTLGLVAKYGHANSQLYAGRPEVARTLAGALLAGIDPARHSALAGRTSWLIGIIESRRGNNDAGARYIEQARAAYQRAGERDNLGAVIGIVGERARLAGDDATAFARLHESLHMLRPFSAGTWRHNVLFLLAGMTARAGLPLAAAAIESEDAGSAQGSGLAVNITEALIGRAGARWLAGDRRGHAALVDSAARLVESLAPEPRVQLGADLSVLRAQGMLDDDPKVARLLLDSAIAVFEPRHHLQKLARALVLRAQFHLRSDDDRGAERDLGRAAALYKATSDSTGNLAMRASLLASARAVVDQLASLRLASGRDREALEAIERGRVAFTGRAPARPTADDVIIAFPAVGVVIDYALLGDTVAAWVADRDSARLTITPVSRAELRETSNRVRTALELGIADSALAGDLERLHAWLVAPIVHRLAMGGQAAIVADGELGDVPFAALRSAATGRYLIEDLELRFAGTLREATLPSLGDVVPDDPLLVAVPGDPGRSGLPSLPSAAAEVDAVARLYRAPRRQTGGAGLARSLPATRMLHFAGHALFDDVRPDQSRLDTEDGGLTARAIAGLDLGLLRLVVLSACETVRVSGQRGNGLAGLAEAFLSAGAGGVVGSLWKVDDGATRRLMEEFHTRYAREGRAAAALRTAQLALLQSKEPFQRSTSAWAAFRYVGR